MAKLWQRVTRLFGSGRSLPEIPPAAPEPDRSDETFRFTQSYPPPKKGIPLHSIRDIYKTHEEDLILPIFHALGLTEKDTNRYLLPVFMNYISYVHLLPGSRSDHHCGLGGLFYHGLDTALYAVKFSEGYMPYQGTNPGLKSFYETQWRVAVTIAALLHDIAKPVTDIVVSSLDGTQEWNPNIESLYDWAASRRLNYYCISYRSHRADLHNNPAIITQLVSRIVPADTVGFITAHGFREIWEDQLLNSFSAESDSIIRKIALQSDMASVRDDNQEKAGEGTAAFGISSHLMFVRVLKDLLEDHTHGFAWKLNEPGAHVFYSGIRSPDTDKIPLYITWSARELKDLYRIVDQEQEQLEGFPRNPGRLSEILADKLYAVAKPGNASMPKYRRIIRGTESSFLAMEARIQNALAMLRDYSEADIRDLDRVNMALAAAGLESLPVIQFLRKDLVFETAPQAGRLFFLEKTETGFAISAEPEQEEEDLPEQTLPEEAPAAEMPAPAPEPAAPKIAKPEDFAIEEEIPEEESGDGEREPVIRTEAEILPETERVPAAAAAKPAEPAPSQPGSILDALAGITGKGSAGSHEEDSGEDLEDLEEFEEIAEEDAKPAEPAKTPEPPAKPVKAAEISLPEEEKPAKTPEKKTEPEPRTEAKTAEEKPAAEKTKEPEPAQAPAAAPAKKFFSFSGSTEKKEKKTPEAKKPLTFSFGTETKKKSPEKAPEMKPAPAPDKTPEKKTVPAPKTAETAVQTIRKPAPAVSPAPQPAPAASPENKTDAPEKKAPGKRYYIPDMEVRQEIARNMVRNEDGIRMLPRAAITCDGNSKLIKQKKTEDLQKWDAEMQKGAKAFAGKLDLTREQYLAKNGIIMELDKKPAVTDTGREEARERLRKSYLDTIRKLPSEIRELFAPVLRGESKISSGLLATNNTLYGFRVDHLWELGLFMELKNFRDLSDYLLNNNVIRKNPNNPLSLYTQIGNQNCLCLEKNLTEALLFFGLEFSPLSENDRIRAEEGAKEYLESETPAPPPQAKKQVLSPDEMISRILNALADEFQAGGGEISGKVTEKGEFWEAEDNFMEIFERIKVHYKNPLLTSSAIREKLQTFKPVGARKFRIKAVKRLLLLKGTRKDEQP